MYPKAHQVGAYLEEYARRFIPDDTITLNRKVISANLEGSPQKWTVGSRNTSSGTEHSDDFDYMIVASGFFDQPDRTVEDVLPHGGASSKVQHSADFRNISSFGEQAGNIVVVGGGISGSEAAANDDVNEKPMGPV